MKIIKKTVDPPLFYDILRGLKALCGTGLLKFSETKDSLVVAETDKSSKYFQVQSKRL